MDNRDKSNPGIFLGPASCWPTKNAQVVHYDETAGTYPIRDADNRQIGHVQRNGNGKWAFRIFGRADIPVSSYNSKEEALDGARSWV